ncbi:MAG TPA: hypothetical protein VE861_15855 [Gemmatimonadaceae bacterium]|nr:hypothetical protein [Gemmatimonadaceae bacterium]
MTRLTTWPGASAPSSITYRIRESTAGVVSFDELRTVTPSDTIILPLAPGTYVVEAQGLPARCVLPRGSALQGITLTEADNTGIIRYQVECRGLLSISVIADGWDVDDDFVYRIRNSADRSERTGITSGNDTLTVEDIPAGDIEIDLGGVAPNCAITTDGGMRQRLKIESTGGAAVTYRVQCSEVARQPRITAFTSGYMQGASIFQFRVFDPDGDLLGYYWDITDCEGNSVLADKRERVRLNLRGGRGATNDTLTIVGAFELGLENAALQGRCTEIRVFDARSNVSAIVTHKIGSATGAPPTVRFFNATLQGQAFVSSVLEASDPDGDIVGHFVLVRLRDGVLATADGVPDLGSMDAVGYVGLNVPNIPTTGRIKWDDVYSVIVYIIDARGNVIRVEDDDIFK